jgi:uncharacterized RmlC-like cupin family protein
MAKTKYGHLVKKLPFSKDVPGGCRQGTELNGDFLGLDAHIKYGAFWSAGKVGEAPYGIHKHDFNQVLLWLGADCADLSELGAEVELSLGEKAERDRHVFTSSSVVYVPTGTPHFPAAINSMDKRFIYMELSQSPECKTKPVALDKEIPEAPLATWFSKNSKRIEHLTFHRKSAWHYGPLNRDDSGGSIAEIHCKDFPFGMMWESIKKAPYRFGPVPDKPHVHTWDEFLFFIGADTDDLGNLGGECEMYMGKEMERHVITEPTVVVQPKGFPHCPLVVTKLEKPFIFAVVYPYGSVAPKPSKT